MVGVWLGAAAAFGSPRVTGALGFCVADAAATGRGTPGGAAGERVTRPSTTSPTRSPNKTTRSRDMRGRGKYGTAPAVIASQRHKLARPGVAPYHSGLQILAPHSPVSDRRPPGVTCHR